MEGDCLLGNDSAMLVLVLYSICIVHCGDQCCMRLCLCLMSVGTFMIHLIALID